MDNIISVYREGEAYLHKLQKMDFEKAKLGPEVAYNMICMSAEAMLSAVLMKYDEVVEHGSISAMLRATSIHLPVRLGLIDEGRFINRFHTWCSLESIKPKKIEPADLKRMVKCVEEIDEMVKCQFQ
ncbi:hypothetical protein ACE1ET_18290 [Saccharicrinis sp. FJH62]|uniref:hypothetical protein n=1 Tax=Saccharicrinis sp. FJH62 TaxID=3344657 RepID=UPI0035D4B425